MIAIIGTYFKVPFSHVCIRIKGLCSKKVRHHMILQGNATIAELYWLQLLANHSRCLLAVCIDFIDFVQKSIYTLYNVILRIARNFLETREYVKISTHPFCHTNLDWFLWEWSKKKFFFGRMYGLKFWRFPWFPGNFLLCVIKRYTVYLLTMYFQSTLKSPTSFKYVFVYIWCHCEFMPSFWS